MYGGLDLGQRPWVWHIWIQTVPGRCFIFHLILLLLEMFSEDSSLAIILLVIKYNVTCIKHFLRDSARRVETDCVFFDSFIKQQSAKRSNLLSQILGFYYESAFDHLFSICKHKKEDFWGLLGTNIKTAINGQFQRGLEYFACDVTITSFLKTVCNLWKLASPSCEPNIACSQELDVHHYINLGFSEGFP